MWLVTGFVVVVVAFGRWQGVRALLGLVAGGLVLVAFVVPALLRDEPALIVALAGTVAVAFVAIYSLPLLLFFSQGSQPIGRLLTGEVIAVEVVRMLVGSVGLVLSVPITTALAAAVLGVDDTDSHAGHHHGPLREGPPAVETAARLSWRQQRARDRDPWSDFAPDERRF